MTPVVQPARRHSGEGAISAPDTTPVVIVVPQPPANDMAGSKRDSRDLDDLVDALADYTADLLSRGQLDELLPEPDLKGSSDRKIAFTSAGPPSIK
jgi:hypothetical protein